LVVIDLVVAIFEAQLGFRQVFFARITQTAGVRAATGVVTVSGSVAVVVDLVVAVLGATQVRAGVVLRSFVRTSVPIASPLGSLEVFLAETLGSGRTTFTFVLGPRVTIVLVA
jgi:hypothetical protein